MKIKYIVCLFLFTGVILFHSTSFSQETIVTDRPDQSESAVTVPHHAFQLETGGIGMFDNSGDAAWGGILLRYGLFDGFELRLGSAFGKYNDEDGSSTGLNPIEMGFKSQITRQKGALPEIAFLGSLLIPGIASSSLDVNNVAPVFKFAFSNQICPVFSIGYNLGALWDGTKPDPVWLYSLTLGASITDNLGCFIEPYGSFSAGAYPIAILDGGFTYKITPLIQVDISGGVGLNEPSPDGFISAGFSFRTK